MAKESPLIIQKPVRQTVRSGFTSRQLILPVVGSLALGFAILSIGRHAPSRTETAPLVMPAVRPSVDGSVVAGIGLVEPASEVVACAPHVAGVVAEVRVRPGDVVTTGAMIYRIEDSQVRRDLELAEAQLRMEESRWNRLQALPRPEEVPPAEARLLAAQAEESEARTRYESRHRVGGRFVAPEEIEITRQGVLATAARVAEASASLKLIQAGTWEADLSLQRAALEAAQAQVAQVRTRLDLHTVRAPLSGTILRVSVRAGEFAPTGGSATALVEMGDLSQTHVRVEVDEEDLPRLVEGRPAVAYPRGDGKRPVRLEFVRSEPSLRAKRNLSGASNERIDTRIQEFIYQVVPPGQSTDGPIPPVGRQLDVYIMIDPKA
jgi:multidrug efflux pump subunit AcrA (membrane-fusion protein)